MRILVTGGIGFIGSHTCVSLLERNHSLVIVDNLCNSKIEVLDRIKQISGKDVAFYQRDVTDETALETVFSWHAIDGVIHFAGLKAVVWGDQEDFREDSGGYLESQSIVIGYLPSVFQSGRSA